MKKKACFTAIIGCTCRLRMAESYERQREIAIDAAVAYDIPQRMVGTGRVHSFVHHCQNRSFRTMHVLLSRSSVLNNAPSRSSECTLLTASADVACTTSGVLGRPMAG